MSVSLSPESNFIWALRRHLELFKRQFFLQRVQYLKDIEWIDTKTRAVFVEFNLYNAAVNLFCVSYILFEFLNTGGEIK